MKLTASELKKYLRDIVSGRIKDKATDMLEKAVSDTLYRKVFVRNIDDVYEIQTASEMRQLIRNRQMPKKGSYNWEYARWKKVRGLPPHVKTGKMKAATTVGRSGDAVTIEIPLSATKAVRYTPSGRAKEYNFGPIHEKRKSILKATMVLGWEDYMKIIKEAYTPK